MFNHCFHLNIARLCGWKQRWRPGRSPVVIWETRQEVPGMQQVEIRLEDGWMDDLTVFERIFKELPKEYSPN